MLDGLEGSPKLGSFLLLTSHEGAAPQVLGLHKLEPETPIIPKDPLDPFQHQGFIPMPGCQNTYAPKHFRGANICPLYHVVLLSTVSRLPEEARKLLVKASMYSLWQDVESHRVHGETR